MKKSLYLILSVLLIGIVMSGCGTERTLEGYIFKVEKTRFLFAVIPVEKYVELKGKTTGEIMNGIDPKRYKLYWMLDRDTSALREGEKVQVTVKGDSEDASFPGGAKPLKVRKTNEMLASGYVLKTEKGRVLLGENMTFSEYEQVKDLSAQDIVVKAAAPMIWLKSKNAEDIKAGDKITAVFQGPIDMPNPANAEADKIVLESK
ncbi:YobA family protein [Metabacillus sp. GX 13764]|uniref:DUF3221 domain-containing protein n=1 Tax=Metabacillus kandeliae TaxID=2900151 RepID=UPI001E491505|nr:DUF3221 domain-containing protein [Metabacillus kandeliae]MCD7034219.1 YobA family protein [Metabacillus kandeliae]